MLIRIDYFVDVEETEADPLGPFPEGSGELFRVQRPSISVGGITREDVVRLEPDGDRHVFFGVIERSTWNTERLLLPRGADYAELQVEIEAAGCVFEGTRDTDDGLRIVISIPAGASEEWRAAYERALERASGLSVDAFHASVADEARVRERAARDQQARANWQERWLEHMLRFAVAGAAVAYAVALVVFAKWWFELVLSSNVQALLKGHPAALAVVVLSALLLLGYAFLVVAASLVVERRTLQRTLSVLLIAVPSAMAAAGALIGAIAVMLT